MSRTFRSPAQRALTPQAWRPRFPGFDVLDQSDDWDDVTAGVVLQRLAPTTMLAFFSAREVSIARPMLDRLMGQDSEPRVPVLELVDARLALGETDGWHYDDMPEDGEAWRRTLTWLDHDAQQRWSRPFARLVGAEQDQLIQAVQDAADSEAKWHDYPAGQVWSLWTRYACTAFYSHPWAWNEIGFAGPAYPRGYLNLGVDRREHWEVADQRPQP